MLVTSPSLLLLYLSHRGDQALCSQVWQNILSGIDLHREDVEKNLPPLLDAAEHNVLPVYLKPVNHELDDLVNGFLVEIRLDARGPVQQIVRRLLRTPGIVISLICSVNRIQRLYCRAVFGAYSYRYLVLQASLNS